MLYIVEMTSYTLQHGSLQIWPKLTQSLIEAPLLQYDPSRPSSLLRPPLQSKYTFSDPVITRRAQHSIDIDST